MMTEDFIIDEALYYTEPLLEHRKEDFDYLTRVGRELWERIEDLLPKTKPEYGNCHGDHHGGNLHVDENGKMTLYDFDCYGYGYRAYDISVFLWNRALNFGMRGIGKAKVTRRWNAFLKGYSKTRAVSERELEATKIFVPIRHIWMVGSHTQKAETFGRSWMNDGYFNNHIDFIKRWIERNKIL